jgi:protein-disulfide isomerase
MKIIKFLIIPLLIFIISCSEDKDEAENQEIDLIEEDQKINEGEYEYSNFIVDNSLTPIKKSSLSKAVDFIEFSSFSCSHCAAFHNETLKEIKESDVYENINYYIVDYPLNQAAFYASIIANCNSDIKPSYIDSVYENYEIWTKSDSGEKVIELLNNYGLQLGLEDKELKSCLNNEDLQNSLLSIQVAAESNFGVQNTPTFLIGGDKLQGNRPASEFIKLIKKKLNNK